MFKITPFFLALLASQASASPIRSLSEEMIISYEPKTVVTDQAAIDLDQEALEAQLAAGTDEGMANAMKIYTEGAFSKSYAEITLDAALASPLPKGTDVKGTSTNGDEIRGATQDEADAGDKIIRVRYRVTGVQESFVGCQVGGNPDPVLDGCFQPTGTMTIAAIGDQPYSYEPTTGNKNARSLQGFSKQAKAKMYDCEKCPYKTYQKFYDYYKAYDYGDKWVLAAFNKAQANFENGSADFSSYTGDGLNEAIKKGTACLNVWMYVNRELEDAIDDCENSPPPSIFGDQGSCTTEACNDDQVHAWDEAVAFYTGSIPKASKTGGVLLYTLAEKRCGDFGTCVQDGAEAGMATVNSQIFQLFRTGKQNLQQGECADAEKVVAEITSLMSVPMIQGTLRYAHIIGEQNGMTEKAEAEGATFAAAVLPILHACSASDATTVYNNMRTGSGAGVDFAAVKEAFEKNYDCMQIKCEDIGGLLQADGESFFDGAGPCGSPSSGSSSSSGSSNGDSSAYDLSGAFEYGVALAAGITTAVVAALV